MSNLLPLAPNGIFRSIQGEAFLSGWTTVFIRLAGCPVGCAFCDTDYSLFEKASTEEIASRVASLLTPGVEWLSVTGGEPAIHDLSPLCRALSQLGRKLHLSTSGHYAIPAATLDYFSFTSVSPHDPEKLVLRHGSEVKLVPGLAGKHLSDFAPVLEDYERWFEHCWVQPCDGLPGTMQECLSFVEDRPRWRMAAQAHKDSWRLP